MMTHSNTFNFRSTVEPIPGFRIDLTASRTYVENMQEYYYADGSGNFQASNKFNSGNFNMSFMSWRTAFERPTGDDSYHSSAMMISAGTGLSLPAGWRRKRQIRDI
jgi:cell surface protein SprA